MLHRPSIRSARSWLILGAMLPMPTLLLSACTPPTGQAAPNFDLRQDTPEAAAHSALRAIQAVLNAQHAHQPDLARTGYDRLRTLAAEADILARFEGRNARFRALLGSDDVVTGVMKNWTAAVAYYVRGADFGQTIATPVESAAEPRREPERVSVRVLARGADDEAWIRLLCVRGADQLWRVSRIDFYVPPTVAARHDGASTLPHAATTAPAASRPGSP